jgi:hypothetical protein
MVKTKNNGNCGETTDPRLKGTSCRKNLWALDRVEGPRANATGLSFQEGTQNDYR